MRNEPNADERSVTAFRWAKLEKPLDMAATAISLVASIAVVAVATAMFLREVQKPSAPEHPIPKQPISIVGAALEGSPTAPSVLIVFSDFQCPFCRTFAQKVLPQVRETFVASGKVQLAYMQYPLVRIHPLAMKAAEEAICAEAQGRYWPMHDELFQGPELTEQDLDAFPAAIGLDGAAFEKCMRDPATSALVGRDMALGKAMAVSGTPTFYFGPRVGPQTVRVTKSFNASRTFEQVASQLDSVRVPTTNGGLPLP